MKVLRRIKMTIVVAVVAFLLMAAPAMAKTWKITVAAGHPPVFLFISAIHDHFHSIRE